MLGASTARWSFPTAARWRGGNGSRRNPTRRCWSSTPTALCCVRNERSCGVLAPFHSAAPPDPMRNRALELQLAPAGEHNARASALATRLEWTATHALFDELALYPKPGLVSLRDAGAH